YTRVYGGDVSAGLPTPCQGWDSGAPNNGGIYTWNDGTGKGGATQFAAFANRMIDQFSTATLRGSPPGPTNGLTFAKSGSYGGNFISNNMVCPYNYYGNGAATATP